MRGNGGVSAFSVKCKQNLAVGKAAAAGNGIVVRRVPGKRLPHSRKNARLYHPAFSGAAFLCRTAVKTNFAGNVLFLHIPNRGFKGKQGSRTQEVVSAAVSQIGQGVVFRKQGNAGSFFPLFIRSHKSGSYVCYVFRNSHPLPLQIIRIGLVCKKLFVFDFRMVIKTIRYLFNGRSKCFRNLLQFPYLFLLHRLTIPNRPHS